MKTVSKTKAPRGFALVVTLTLMILLTVIAVGLLTLSSISLRSTGHGASMAQARANARLALALAIGELQRTAGPDTRITAPANLVNPKAPPGIAGVWKSWRPPSETPDYAAAKADDNFLGYLMSNAKPGTLPTAANLPTGTGTPIPLVGPGSVGPGNKDAEIGAPFVGILSAAKKQVGGVSWVALDEGVKSRLDLEPDKPATSLGETITQIGSPARNGFQDVNDLGFLVASTDAQRNTLGDVLPKLVSLDGANLAAGKAGAIDPYFHDFNVDSESVQADVAGGGLKTDLSVMFDSESLPSDYAQRRLYSDTNAPLGGGRAPDPMWALYQSYAELYRKTTANDNPMDGFQAAAGPRFRLIGQRNPSPTPGQRYEPDMSTVRDPILMPTVARVDIVFSLVVRDVHSGRAADLKAKGYPYMVHLMYLPVITLHNPFNVPLRFKDMEIEFSDLPMGFQFFVNGQPATDGMRAFNQMYSGKEAGSEKKTFKLTLTGDIESSKEVVMGPGETRIFGKPFPPSWRWVDEKAGDVAAGDGLKMFDWRNDKTKAGAPIMPGMITGPTDGIGYDLDWLTPGNKLPWLTARTGESILPVNGQNDAGKLPAVPRDTISLRYGPMSQASSPDHNFSVTVRMKNRGVPTDVGTTQVFFKDDARLKEILEEGASLRYPEKRKFPESYPRPTERPKTSDFFYESNNNPISNYANARPFAIFSLSAKTTKESFTPSRPVADTGAAFQMATCDFTSTASQGSEAYEFMLFPVIASAIQSDGEKGYFFGGHGTTSAVYYELPLAPLQSIAQLRHANGASIGSVPYVTYSVGESRAHPAVPADKALYTAGAGKTYYDHSWLANDRLWDRYWFSTLATLQGKAYSGSSALGMKALADDFFDGSRNLPNGRNIAWLPAGKTAKDAAGDAVDPNGTRSAAYMMTAGGFNVNSTSVAAWTSILSGLCDTDIPLFSAANEKIEKGAPFLRTRRPVLGRSGGTAKEELWSGYRTLKADEIKTLAEKIVKEVRARGPFLSMSEFVNRRLGAPGDLTESGAIQAALDKSGLNAGMLANADPIAPADVGGFGWNNTGAVTGNTGAGSPGEISQGDILTAIGSFATVRSDTFKIRAYGDARNPAGAIVARAWCEAVVQRIPTYVDPADAPEAVAAAAANVAFGRQFKIVAFRWLSPEEI